MTLANTKALNIIQTVGLDRFMEMLEQRLQIPVELRKQRLELLERLTTLRRTTLLVTRDTLEGEKARLFLAVLEAKDDKDKARYGNEDARKAALALLMAQDADYKAALDAYRRAEGDEALLQQKIDELDSEIKSVAETIWGLRTLVEGSVAAINAVSTFDGPKLPAEIAHTFKGALPTEIPFTISEATLEALRKLKEAA